MSEEGETPPRTVSALLDDEAEEAAHHGRVGYGRIGRFTPLILGLLLVLILGVIWWLQRDAGPDSPPIGRAAGALAPDFTLTLLDGEKLQLSELRGDVVVLNFWASWCAPCRQEMPVLQAYWDRTRGDGENTTIVGVGVRTDHDEDARNIVAEGGFTYPIGRDTDTDQPGIGPVEAAFGVPAAYPTTIVIRGDGVVDGFHVGPVTQEMLAWMVSEARRNTPT
jgi:peroxiredoxin